MFCGLDIIQVTAHNPNLSTLYLTSTRLESIWAPLKTEFGERLIKNKNLDLIFQSGSNNGSSI